jgi:hypothetical protein
VKRNLAASQLRSERLRRAQLSALELSQALAASSTEPTASIQTDGTRSPSRAATSIPATVRQRLAEEEVGRQARLSHRQSVLSEIFCDSRTCPERESRPVTRNIAQRPVDSFSLTAMTAPVTDPKRRPCRAPGVARPAPRHFHFVNQADMTGHLTMTQ